MMILRFLVLSTAALIARGSSEDLEKGSDAPKAAEILQLDPKRRPSLNQHIPSFTPTVLRRETSGVSSASAAASSDADVEAPTVNGIESSVPDSRVWKYLEYFLGISVVVCGVTAVIRHLSAEVPTEIPTATPTAPTFEPTQSPEPTKSPTPRPTYREDSYQELYDGQYTFVGDKYLCFGKNSVYSTNPEKLSAKQKKLCDDANEMTDMTTARHQWFVKENARIPICLARDHESHRVLPDGRERTQSFVDGANKMSEFSGKEFYVYDNVDPHEPGTLSRNVLWGKNAGFRFDDWDTGVENWRELPLWERADLKRSGKQCIPLMIDTPENGKGKRKCGQFSVAGEHIDQVEFYLNDNCAAKGNQNYLSGAVETHEAGHALLPHYGKNYCKENECHWNQPEHHSPFNDVMAPTTASNGVLTNRLKNSLIAHHAKWESVEDPEAA